MKRIVLSAALAVALSGGFAMAQSDAAPQGGPHGKWHHHAPDPQRETEFLTQKLGLSSDQAAKIEPILADGQQKMAALHSNTSLSHEEIKTQSFAIMKDTHTQMASVLTPEQLETLKTLHHGHRGGGHGQWQGHGQGQGQGQGQTTPPGV